MLRAAMALKNAEKKNGLPCKPFIKKMFQFSLFLLLLSSSYGTILVLTPNR